MEPPPLEYAGPTTPKWTPRTSPWLVGGAAVALTYLLAGICFVPKFGSRPGKLAAANVDVSSLNAAIDLFHQDTGRVPTDVEGLGVLVTPPADRSHWHGPYVRRTLPNDPWGRAYVYHATRTSGDSPFTVLSVGPDGVEGTADDIVNR